MADNAFVKLVRRSSRGASGQVAVETAIVMPAFVFILLGMLQLGLMHQARVMTKYAAYRAVRVGSIHSAKMPAMTQAALAAVLPYSGHQSSISFFKTTPADFPSAWAEASKMNSSKTDRIVDVMICEPYTSGGSAEGDFDDPEGALAALTPLENDNNEDPATANADDPTPSEYDWHQYNAGRLTVQVTFYHRMVIPFVNGLIWHVVRGDESTQLMRTLRLGGQSTSSASTGSIVQSFDALAQKGIYIMPIRASWSMRMQSNFLEGGDFKLPGTNDCKVPWSHPAS